jgi:hypothetical protein
MARPDVVAEHYAAQQRQAQAALIQARRQWRKMGPDLDVSWARIVNRLTLVVASAQLGAARAGAAYVPAALEEIGQQVDPEAVVRPEGWSGVASDGRPLDSLLYSAVVHAKDALALGSAFPEALSAAEGSLDMIVRTQVADAARGAAGAAIVTRPRIGYTRMVNPPCCQRCAVQAGKFFKWNAGFQRHPRCDCRHIPCGSDGFENYTDTVAPDQVKDLTEAQRKAISDGADMNQVINSHRKRASSGMTTSEGTTRRGMYGGYVRNPDGAAQTLRKGAKGEKVGARLTPEAIYRVSATREEALAKLRQYGYLI